MDKLPIERECTGNEMKEIGWLNGWLAGWIGGLVGWLLLDFSVVLEQSLWANEALTSCFALPLLLH